MNRETVNCLYCQTKHELVKGENKKIENCANCGMPLSKNNPEGTRARYKRFLPFFWFIVVFCLVMIFYLPR